MSSYVILNNCKVVAINALSKPEFLAYKFKYDKYIVLLKVFFMG